MDQLERISRKVRNLVWLQGANLILTFVVLFILLDMMLR